MPVRSLHSSVLKWPDQPTIDLAVREWLNIEQKKHPEIVALGYFGSYARGDWGVGSDLDLVAIINQTTEPFEKRALTWDLSGLPLATEIIIYTKAEWEKLKSGGGRFIQTLLKETIWLFGSP